MIKHASNELGCDFHQLFTSMVVNRKFEDVMDTSETLDNTVLKSEIKSELQNELYQCKKWCLFHAFGILLALFLLSTTLTPLLFLLNLIMLAIYLERQSVLKATLQDHFGLSDLDHE